MHRLLPRIIRAASSRVGSDKHAPSLSSYVRLTSHSPVDQTFQSKAPGMITKGKPLCSVGSHEVSSDRIPPAPYLILFFRYRDYKRYYEEFGARGNYLDQY